VNDIGGKGAMGAEQHKVSLTIVNNLFMIIFMIRTFADAQTERFFTTGRSKHFPPDVLRRAGKRLTQLAAAVTLDDLRMPPSNRLEALGGDRAGQWSIRINDQWRVCFRFENGEACDVEITDYH
jgi:proteic killer suppression protein